MTDNAPFNNDVVLEALSNQPGQIYCCIDTDGRECRCRIELLIKLIGSQDPKLNFINKEETWQR